MPTDYFYLEMTEKYVNANHRAGGVAVNIWTGHFPNTQTFLLESICSEFWKALTFCVQVLSWRITLFWVNIVRNFFSEITNWM